MSKQPRFNSLEYFVLHETSKSLRMQGDIKTQLREILQLLHEHLGMERGIISLVDLKTSEIKVDVMLGMDRRQKDVKYLMGEGITGKVVQEGRPIAILNVDEEPLFLDRSGQRKGLDRSTISFICVPICFQDKVVGALSVDHTRTSKKESLESEINFLGDVVDLIASHVRRRQIEQDNERLRMLEDYRSSHIIGNSSVMRELARNVNQVADSSTNVMITGETGTGKELAARDIHDNSPRRGAPLVRINCGAIPENLVESELFGHEKGSFTGAITQRIGRFEMARGGSIFLDEIGELPANAQVKLLRVLQERELERVGGTKTIKVNVRVIAATNRPLEDDVQKGRFRSDLYYRLYVFPVHVPPLRERGADVMLLADYFVQRFSKELDKKIDRIDTPAIDMLMAYHWPGNVRELENTMERGVLLSEDGVIHGHHLPPSLQMNTSVNKNNTDGRFETLVQNYERQLIIEALKNCWGNQSEAARQLGTTKRVIQYKIQKLDVDYKRYNRGSAAKALH